MAGGGRCKLIAFMWQHVWQDRSENLSVRDFKTLSNTMDCHAESAPLVATQTHQITQLQADCFKLLKNQIEYDLQALRVAREKVATHDSKIYYTKQDWKRRRWDDCKNAAKHFLQRYSTVLLSDTGESLLKEYHEFIQKTVNRLSLDKEGCVRASMCLAGGWGVGT
jgi:hypothetical protein